MSRWRIGPTALGQGRAGKRKHECHQDLVAARGGQRDGADHGDERRSGSPSRPAPTSGGARRAGRSPASPSSDEQHLDDPAGASSSSLRRSRCSTSARPCGRSSPRSRPGLRRSSRRSSACRSCRAPRRAAGPGSGSATRSKSGVGLTSSRAVGVGLEVAVQVALDEQRLDPLVFAVGGQVGADVERLAAAGRDRHRRGRGRS